MSEAVLTIDDIPMPCIHEQVVEFIGRQFQHTDGLIYTIIGVDNKPPKCKEGVYFTLKVHGQKCTHVKVGDI